jgi:hypothetical protein
MRNAIERFMDKVIPEPNSGCWLWDGAANENDYGRFRINGRTIQSHRFSYSIFFGEFDDQMHVLHKCDVTCCVNPNHLFLGTHQENIKDMDMKKRRASKLDDGKIKYIKSSNKSAVSLAKELGVTRQSIHNVRSQRTWGV